MMNFVAKEPIEKGWSADKKYRAADEHGTQYLLRIAPAERYEADKAEFERMKRAEALGIAMCRPVEFGMCEEGVYTVQSWIDGTDAGELIPSLPAAEQYAFGLEAGRILRKLHTIPAPEGLPDWETYFNGKIDRKLRMYADCPLKYENAEAFITYLNANRHLLKGRPVTYQHGDYHIGNMMVDKTGRLCVIDFDRDDYGDPWEEFNRIVWCGEETPEFARGMVDGYFDGQPPMEFWRLLLLYISSNTLSSLPWAIPFGEEQVEVMRAQAAHILRWYDGFRMVIPSWYR